MSARKINLLAIFIVLLATACATPKTEIRHIKDLWVVYTSSEKINQAWQKRGGRGKVRGFYDYKTNTIYTQKDNYSNLGHEMKHVLEGEWHK